MKPSLEQIADHDEQRCWIFAPARRCEFHLARASMPVVGDERFERRNERRGRRMYGQLVRQFFETIGLQ